MFAVILSHCAVDQSNLTIFQSKKVCIEAIHTTKVCQSLEASYIIVAV